MHRLGRQRIGQEIALPRRGPGRSGQGRPATLLAGCLLGCASIAVPAQGLAQGLAVPGDQLRPGETRPALPEFLPPERPGGGVELPPVPAGPEAPLPPIERGPTFRLGGVRFVGNTVFGDEELAAELADLIGRPVTLDDLEEARIRLTLHYVNRGYINSGAVLPPQQVTDGIVTFEIVEGALTRIDIRGQEGLNPDYIRRRLELSAGPPLNIHDLEERFRLLRQDPLIDPIEGLNGALGPGMHPGEAVLDLKVTRARPYALTLSFDNQRPPSIGAETGRITGTVRNLTG